MAKVGNEQARASQLVDLFASAGESDLKAIDERIAELKKEIDECVKPRKAEIKSLVSVKRMLDMKLHPRLKAAKEKKPKASTESTSGTMLQEKIFDLIHSEGPMTVHVLAAKLDSKPGYVSRAVRDCNWFKLVNGDVAIATSKNQLMAQ